jgi:ribosomal protein L11 methyltransferase
MITIELDCEEEAKDLLIAELWEERCAGITELDGGLLAFFKEDARGPELEARFAANYPRVRPVDDEDWLAIAREQLEPVLVGERFFICPEWRDDPTPEHRIRIAVNPGMAFGTGSHETTQLCIEALERHVLSGSRVLDVGTGSGILCEAARKLGAALAVGCDNDPEAVPIAKQKAPLVFAGSAEAAAGAAFDIIVANIAAAPVRELAAEFRRCLRPAGALLLSGFEEEEIEKVIEAFPGMKAAVRAKRAWRLVEMTPDA